MAHTDSVETLGLSWSLTDLKGKILIKAKKPNLGDEADISDYTEDDDAVVNKDGHWEDDAVLDKSHTTKKSRKGNSESKRNKVSFNVGRLYSCCRPPDEVEPPRDKKNVQVGV